MAIAKAARPRALLTLTVSSKHHETPERAAQELKRGLRLLRLRLARHPKLKNFEFLAVFEKHKSGYPHLHLVIRGKYIPWQYLRESWEAITGSTHVHIIFIKNTAAAAGYVSKYIGKDLAAFEGCKRWWRSHGYSEGADDEYELDLRYRSSQRWQINLHTLRFAMRLEGLDIEPTKRGGIAWRAPPDHAPPLDWYLYAAQGQRRAFRW